MKILLVNSQLYPEFGGDAIYTLRLQNLLNSKGQIVELWGMNDRRNIQHTYTRYDVPSINYNNELTRNAIKHKLSVALNAIYSLEAKRRIGYVLEQFSPEIVHINSVHYYLTTSIVDEIYRRGIPIVWTQHNLALVCCNFMFRDGHICEKCKPSRYYMPIITKCKKQSLQASIIGSLQLYLDYFRKTYQKVNKLIVLNSFYRKKLIEFGIDSQKIEIIPNFFSVPKISEKEKINEKYIIFFGRLSKEKGVQNLISAINRIDDATMKLKIVGDGPFMDSLIKTANSDKRIAFLGYKSSNELMPLIANAYFVVVPSIWYENFPNAILEAYGHAKPVLASRIGGILDMVVDGTTGYLFNPLDIEELVSKIMILWNNAQLVDEMGNNALKKLENDYNEEIHYRKLIALYKST